MKTEDREESQKNAFLPCHQSCEKAPDRRIKGIETKDEEKFPQMKLNRGSLNDIFITWNTQVKSARYVVFFRFTFHYFLASVCCTWLASTLAAGGPTATAWRPAGMRFRRTGPMGRSLPDLYHCCRTSLGLLLSAAGWGSVDIVSVCRWSSGGKVGFFLLS